MKNSQLQQHPLSTLFLSTHNLTVWAIEILAFSIFYNKCIKIALSLFKYIFIYLYLIYI